jgi:hypothetical protein
MRVSSLVGVSERNLAAARQRDAGRISRTIRSATSAVMSAEAIPWG